MQKYLPVRIIPRKIAHNQSCSSLPLVVSSPPILLLTMGYPPIHRHFQVASKLPCQSTSKSSPLWLHLQPPQAQPQSTLEINLGILYFRLHQATALQQPPYESSKLMLIQFHPSLNSTHKYFQHLLWCRFCHFLWHFIFYISFSSSSLSTIPKASS